MAHTDKKRIPRTIVFAKKKGSPMLLAALCICLHMSQLTHSLVCTSSWRRACLPKIQQAGIKGVNRSPDSDIYQHAAPKIPNAAIRGGEKLSGCDGKNQKFMLKTPPRCSRSRAN
jgi:hypothetical protein